MTSSPRRSSPGKISPARKLSPQNLKKSQTKAIIPAQRLRNISPSKKSKPLIKSKSVLSKYNNIDNIEEESIAKQMRVLGISFHQETLDFLQLKKSSYILIRHGVSEANFA